jgi:hypothetical protein
MSFTGNQRRIADLLPGESAFVPDHAAWIEGEHMFVNADFPLRGLSAVGSHNLRLVRFPDGRLACDVSEVRDGFHRGGSPYGRCNRIQVDMEIVKPNADGARRLTDLPRGGSAFIATGSAWIWGPHMWLDGLAEIADTMSADKALRVVRNLDGEYTVDLSRCGDAQYAGNPQQERNWPLQVARAL